MSDLSKFITKVPPGQEAIRVAPLHPTGGIAAEVIADALTEVELLSDKEAHELVAKNTVASGNACVC